MVRVGDPVGHEVRSLLDMQLWLRLPVHVWQVQLS